MTIYIDSSVYLLILHSSLNQEVRKGIALLVMFYISYPGLVKDYLVIIAKHNFLWQITVIL